MTRGKFSLVLAFLFVQLPSQAAPDAFSKLQFIPEHGSADRVTQGTMKVSSLLEVLRSRLPNPSQRSLDRMLAKADGVRVYAGGESNGRPLSDKILLETSRPEVLAELSKSLRIDEDPEGLGHDMCFGDPTIVLMSGKKRLAVIGFHHARAIRWDKSWKFDAPLKDGRLLVDWFYRNGIDGPKQAMEAELKEKRRTSADLQKWVMATPACLRPYLNAVVLPEMTQVLMFLPEPDPADELRDSRSPALEESPRQKQLMSVLDESYKDEHDKILALFQWYASGVGAWTGFPAYEELPAQLLLMLPTPKIIDGLNAKNVSEPELEGAARYFASRTFRLAKPRDISLLDDKLRQRLLEHCLKSSDKDKRNRAERAFSADPPLKSADNPAH